MKEEIKIRGSRKRGREKRFILITILLVLTAFFLLGALPASAGKPDAALTEALQPLASQGQYQKAASVPAFVQGTPFQERKLEKNYKEGEILVKFKAGASEESKKSLHKKLGSEKIKEFASLRIHHIKLKKGLSVEDAVKLYKADPIVQYAEPNFFFTAQSIPNDLLFNQLWNMHNTGQSGGTPGADIHAPEAWDITSGSQDVVVAVIDTGVDCTHPDLAANMWVNPGEIPGNGIDDDGNGYVDDVYGINTITSGGSPFDDNGHGTHCAGTIGAVGNNGIGVVGVNWNVKIMACKFLGSGGSGNTADAVECLQYIKAMKDRGINVIATNNSWGGGDFSQALYDAIDAQREILFIAAAGNSGMNIDYFGSFPAGYDLPNVIAVAATDSYDAIADFSNYGKRTVHVAAPGVSILSTLPATNFWGITGGYGNLSGTSMATPHVTGLAALIKAQGSSRSSLEIKNLILACGDSIASLNGKTITDKRINAYETLNCNNRPLLSPLKYPTSIEPGTPVTLSALSINCSASAGPVTVTTSQGEIVNLYDDGITPDVAAGDGIFTASWTPLRDPELLTFSSPAGSKHVSIPSLFMGQYLPEANINAHYNHTPETTGGLPPYMWSITSGALPPGLSMNQSTGTISGNPSTTGSFEFTMQVTDAWNQSVSLPARIRVADTYIVESWAKTYHAEQTAYGKGITVDINGNVYMTSGLFYNGGNGTDILTIKYDQSGNMLWSRIYDNGPYDSTGGIAVDNSGNVYIAGHTNPPNSYDSLIIKYDQTGSLLWSKIYNNGDFEGFNGITADESGNIYTVGGVTPNSLAMPYFVVTKYDSSGNIIWSKNYASSVPNYGAGIALDGAGNVYVAGHTATLHDNLFYYDVLIVKYDPSGNVIWTRTYDTGDIRDFGEAVSVDKAGNVYVAGYPSNTMNGYLTLKYDPAGNLAWARLYSSSLYGGGNFSTGLALDGDGNVYVSGQAWGEEGRANYDFLTIKYDPSGNMLWKKGSDGNDGSDRASGIAVDKNGGVYVTGGSSNDILTIKYNELLHIATSSLPSGEIGVYYSQTLFSSGGKTPYAWSTSSGSLPDGLTLSASGIISGTPTTAGTFDFIVQVTDANFSAATKSLSIAIYDPLIVTTSSLPSGTIGATYNQTLTATGGLQPYTWSGSSGSLPDGLTLSASGIISGAPTAAGTFDFTVQVTDANSFTASRQLSIYVINDLFIMTSALPSGRIDTAYNQTLAATGGLPPYTWSVPSGSLPDGLTLSASGIISGAPTTGGIFSFIVQVTDTNSEIAAKALSVTVDNRLSTTKSWGYNLYGQLGDGTTTQRNTPVEVSGLSNIVAVACGSLHSIALKSDNEVLVWGRNNYGQLGDGTTIDRYTPVEVSGLSSVIAIAGGEYHSLALRDSSVWTWGYNVYGQLGDGTTTQRNTPVQVSGLSGVIAIAGGYYHSAALKSDGTVWTWGYNVYGQLGDGTTTQQNTPVQVSGLSDVIAVAGGSWHSIALKSDGTVWAWGRNNYGQLGDGTTTQRNTPVQVSGLSDVIAIAGGSFHSMALKSDGTVWAWGYNYYGQLGDGTTTQRNAPVQVSGLSDVIAIAGYYHSIALKSDGTVWAWGMNLRGQLGDGTTTNRYTSVQVSDLSGVTAVSAGWTHSLALVSHYRIRIWATLPAGTIGVFYNQSLSASGVPPYAWTIIAGSLPPGLTLTSTGAISGIPTAVGTFNFTAQVTDENGASAIKEFSIPVYGPLSVTTTALQSGAVATYYNQTLTASGGLTPYTWSVISGNLPPGLILDSVTGVISGTPTKVGNYTFTVQVTDANAMTAAMTFSIAIYDPLTIITPSLPYGITSTAYNRTLAASGGMPPHSWSIISGSLPDGLFLDGSTGMISGVPTTVGVFTFTVEVIDAAALSATKDLSITIYTDVSPSTQDWIKKYSLGHDDTAWGVAADRIGNVYVTGWSHNGIDFDSLTIKYDAYGNVIWTRTYNGGNEDSGNAVATDRNGDIYVAGEVYNGSTHSCRITKYDTDGIEQWARTYNGSYTARCFGIKVDGIGNVYAAGDASDGSNSDYLSIKYDPSGNLLWVKTFDSGGHDEAKAIAVDNDGNAYVTGYTSNGSNTDYLTVKYDPSGNLLWTKVYDGGDNDYGWGIAVDAGGSVYVVGDTYNGTDNDCRIIKYDPSGEMLWSRTYDNGGSRDSAHSAAVDAAGDLYVAGDSNGNCLIIKYDPSGNLLWTKTFNGGGFDIAWGIAVGANGAVYVAGGDYNGTNFEYLTIKYNDVPTITTPPSLPSGAINNAYSLILTASGGTPPYRWSIVAGGMPPGLSLDSVTGVISGTPTAAGSFAFTVQVTDASSVTGLKIFSLSVSMEINGSCSPGIAGAPYRCALTAPGGTEPYSWSIVTGSLPVGLTLDGATGEISGIPTTAGAFSFTAQVVDANTTTASKSLSITIYDSLVISTSSLNCRIVGASYNQRLTAAGGLPPYTWSVTSGSLPSGLRLDSVTGEITGIPTQSGDFYFSVQAADANSFTAVKALSIAIAESLSISPSALPYGEVGTPYSVIYEASCGAPVYTWSISSGSLPNGLVLDGATGKISGTPTSVGTSSFAIRVTDNELFTAMKEMTISVADQLVVEQWVRSCGNTGNDFGKDVAVDGNGNVYVAGKSNYDYLTVKYDPSGNMVWTKTYDVWGYGDEATGIAVDRDSAVYVTGSAGGAPSEYLTLKYDLSGAIQWTKAYNRGMAAGIATDGNGNVYVTGKPWSLYSFLTVKYDPSGNEIWARTYGWNYEQAGGIAVDGDGNVYVTGSTYNGVNVDCLTIKYDPSGNEIWAKVFDGGNDEQGNGIAVDAGGNIYVTGQAGASGAYNYLTIKYDPSGNVLWTRIYDEGRNEQAKDIAVDRNGNVYVTGGAGVYYDYNYLTVKYDSSGNILWTKNYKGGNSDSASGIAVDGSGNVYVTGNSYTGANHSDCLTIKYAQVLSIAVSGLPSGINGTPYAQTLTAVGGTIPYAWSIVLGSLPAGLTLNGSTGVIEGIPAATGVFAFTVQVMDANGSVAVKELSLSIVTNADLIISGLTAPAAGAAGDIIVIGEMTRNSGTADAGPSMTSFYLSTNTTLDSSDILLGSRALGALVPGASSQATTSLVIPASTAAGTYYIIAKADANNDVAEVVETNNTLSKTITITPDITPPIVSLISPTAGVTNNRTPLLTYSVSDGTVVVKLDGVVINKVSGNTLDALSDGIHMVRVEATDGAGNTGASEASFRVDTVPPPVGIYPVASPTNSNAQTINGTRETNATITVSVDTAATAGPVAYPTADTWSCVISNLAEGPNNVTVTATDHADNSATTTAGITYDGIAPAVSITTPTVGTTNNKTPLLTYSVSDGTVVVKVDGVVVNKVSGDNLDALADGAHTVRVEATDAAGNIGFAQTDFIVDTTPPVVTIDPVTTPTKLSSQTVTGTREIGATVTVNTSATLGTVSYPASTTWNCTISNLAKGINTITATAMDAAGNIGTATTSIEKKSN